MESNRESPIVPKSDIDKLSGLFRLLMVNQEIDGDQGTMLHDLVMPVDLMFFSKCIKEAKSCYLQFHRQVDETGGVEFALNKSTDSQNLLFGLLYYKGLQNKFEKAP